MLTVQIGPARLKTLQTTWIPQCLLSRGVPAPAIIRGGPGAQFSATAKTARGGFAFGGGRASATKASADARRCASGGRLTTLQKKWSRSRTKTTEFQIGWCGKWGSPSRAPCRGVAQFGRAPEWGSGGREFKSLRPDSSARLGAGRRSRVQISAPRVCD